MSKPDTETVSVAWERATGADSIDTIRRVYHVRPDGKYECCWPDCLVARKNPATLWRHVHGEHDGLGLPPMDFDPAPFL